MKGLAMAGVPKRKGPDIVHIGSLRFMLLFDQNWPAQSSELWPIEKITPYARNSRTHSDEQVAQIAASIREWGWTNPILVDEDGGLIAGHGRLLAARKLGVTQIPTMVAKGWSEAQKKAYVIADNKLALNAGWDLELLAVELGDIQGFDFDLMLTGFSDEELSKLLADVSVSSRDIAYGKAVMKQIDLKAHVENGEAVRDGMLAAYHFAAADPYRAATHNKGIMNGVSAVVLATGNDTRAVEAGAHAYAARGGHYTSLTTWEVTNGGDLAGSIELPMAVGLVGGATKLHPTAKTALKILGVTSARELAQIIAAVGLAQNFSAMKALATTGIQKGHMALHAQNIAMMAGAAGDEIDRVAQVLVAQGTVRIDVAEAELQRLRSGA